MRYWWVRVGDDYGRWIPTGCADKEDAKFYLSAQYGVSLASVKEWLLW